MRDGPVPAGAAGGGECDHPGWWQVRGRRAGALDADRCMCSAAPTRPLLTPLHSTAAAGTRPTCPNAVPTCWWRPLRRARRPPTSSPARCATSTSGACGWWARPGCLPARRRGGWRARLPTRRRWVTARHLRRGLPTRCGSGQAPWPVQPVLSMAVILPLLVHPAPTPPLCVHLFPPCSRLARGAQAPAAAPPLSPTPAAATLDRACRPAAARSQLEACAPRRQMCRSAAQGSPLWGGSRAHGAGGSPGRRCPHRWAPRCLMRLRGVTPPRHRWAQMKVCVLNGRGQSSGRDRLGGE